MCYTTHAIVLYQPWYRHQSLLKSLYPTFNPYDITLSISFMAAKTTASLNPIYILHCISGKKTILQLYNRVYMICFFLSISHIVSTLGQYKLELYWCHGLIHVRMWLWKSHLIFAILSTRHRRNNSMTPNTKETRI